VVDRGSDPLWITDATAALLRPALLSLAARGPRTPRRRISTACHEMRRCLVIDVRAAGAADHPRRLSQLIREDLPHHEPADAGRRTSRR
jgi:hypothetical protein